MIVVDTSALVAILFEEPTMGRMVDRIAEAGAVLLPATVLTEACLVYGGRRGPTGVVELEASVAALGLVVVPYSPVHARAANDAFLAYGKGRHPAALNFGDCMSYAVAKVEGLPLLYVGEDFTRTDLAGA